MKGQFAPSSSDIFLTVGAHKVMSRLPSSMEPVNDTFRTSGLASSVLLTGSPAPVSTESTPRGKPAFSPSTHSASAEKGVCGSG